MSIRESFAGSPKISLVLVGIALIVAVGIALTRFKEQSGPHPVSEGRVYFTIDDGKSWFPDSINRPSPFEKDGKVAYRVYVWKTADGTTFVSHLQRGGAGTSNHGSAATGGSDEARRSAMAGTGAVREPGELTRPGGSGGIEVKRPGTGDTGWVPANSVEGEAIATPQSPRGSNNGLEQVEP